MEGLKEEGRKQKPVGDMLGTFLFPRFGAAGSTQ